MRLKTYLLCAVLALPCFSIAAVAEVFWVDLDESKAEKALLQKNKSNAPSSYRALGIDAEGLRTYLAKGASAQSTTTVTLPVPSGGTMDFSVIQSGVLSPELARKFPNLATYRGYAIDNTAITVSLELTSNGLTAQILEPGNRWVIDPVTKGDASRAISYFSHDLKVHDHSQCLVEGSGRGDDSNLFKSRSKPESNLSVREASANETARSSGTTLRSYRLAVATTGEYGAYHGTKESALSAIVTTMNRVDDIYRKEMAITFELVGNNDEIVFIDADTDPFSGNNSASTLIAESQVQIDSIIGNENYDIGHTFSTGAGGLATLRSVCNSSLKARGVTGSSTPEGDPYDVDFVAHELGHQFGGYHTFNAKNCAVNPTSSSAYEPGGGTIQAYAGYVAATISKRTVTPCFTPIALIKCMVLHQKARGTRAHLKRR